MDNLLAKSTKPSFWVGIIGTCVVLYTATTGHVIDDQIVQNIALGLSGLASLYGVIKSHA